MTEWLVLGAMVIDLFGMDLSINRNREMTLARASSWSVMYVLMALIFAGFVWTQRGPQDAQLFLTAYTLEKVLSVDNLMVFTAVFSYFGIRPENRYRILRWGIIGAAIMRLLFVFVGVSMLRQFGTLTSLIFAGFIL